MNDLLPFTHVTLIFLTSLHKLRPHLSATDQLFALLDSSDTNWSAFTLFLNRLASFFPITSRIEMFACLGTFPAEGKPLNEDYLVRGLVWCQWCFPTDTNWFQGRGDDDGCRVLEDADRQRRRAERVLYLGLTLVSKATALRYDSARKTFYAARGQAVNAGATMASSKSMSARSSASGDLVMVSPTQTPSPPSKQAWTASRTYASIARASGAGNTAFVKQEALQPAAKPSRSDVSRTAASMRIKDEVKW